MTEIKIDENTTYTVSQDFSIEGGLVAIDKNNFLRLKNILQAGGIIRKKQNQFHMSYPVWTNRLQSGEGEAAIIAKGQYATPHEANAFARYSVLKICATQKRIEEVVFTKSHCTAQLVESFILSTKSNDYVSFFLNLRALIEQVAVFYAFSSLITDLVEECDFTKNDARLDFLIKLETDVAKLVKGVRVDLAAVADHGLKSKEKIKYKPNEGYSDLTAKTIMRPIDALGKQVPGTRNGYEFCCEFTHPNSMTHHCFAHSMETKTDSHLPQGIVVRNSKIDVSSPLFILTGFRKPISELLEITEKLLDLYQRENVAIESNYSFIQKVSRKVTRSFIKNYPAYFPNKAPCPCGSEKQTRFCCGKGAFK